jgi:polar amino acid transport system substrate-binding protein
MNHFSVRRCAEVLFVALVSMQASNAMAQAPASSAIKTIVAGTAPKYPPFEFRDPETNKLIGFDIELTEALASRFGAKVEWKDAGFDQMISSLSTRRLDLFLGGMADTEERQKSIDFLDYLVTGAQFYTLKERSAQFPDLQAMCGKRVGTARKTVWPEAIANWSAENCVKAGKPPVTVVGTDGSPDTRLQLKQNRVDAGVQGGETLPYQNSIENGAYVPIGKPFLANVLGMGLSKSNPELIAALHGAFKQILADGTYQKLLVKWGLQDYGIKKAMVNGKE